METGYLLEDPLPPSCKHSPPLLTIFIAFFKKDGRVVNSPDGPVDPREPPHIHYVNEMRNPPRTQNGSSLAHSVSTNIVHICG